MTKGLAILIVTGALVAAAVLVALDEPILAADQEPGVVAQVQPPNRQIPDRPPDDARRRDNDDRPAQRSDPPPMLQGPGMGGGGGPHGSDKLAVNEKYVYILHGDTLFQFDARSLALVNKSRLPELDATRPAGERPRRENRPPTEPPPQAK